mmetsp:Transcript_11402/g.18907  ORF Transcript_11402/g.18907 Transcript_11402/m.18907 type:complete len:1073 (-) Transcript_11402:81-3299(-)
MPSVVKVSPVDRTTSEEMKWLSTSGLTIVVVGASGDLAKKKTYPSLLALYDDNLLPKDTVIYGYARSNMSDEDLRARLRPYLEETKHSNAVVEDFLQLCRYQAGKSYGDQDAFGELAILAQKDEEGHSHGTSNRLFYFAIPPNVFADTGIAIKNTCMQDPAVGWTRLIVEKPFGRDLESFEVLNKTLAENFTEDHIYRIDHYLGKEMVQNLTVLRFSNTWFERVWNANDIQCVILTFKEPFGTEGRGGYFDQYGIIRDILQNHLLQVLTLLTMETPSILEGPGAGKAIRDAKVAVLNAIPPIELDDCILGQYEGYADDPTIENKDTNCPTFALIKLKINTPRWHGVPIFLKAGKALDEKKAEMRIQFKDAPAASFLFAGQDCPRNELVMRLQPNEAVYLKTNVKSPGFAARPIQSELEVNYDTRFFSHQSESNPDAYTRLIFDVLRGRHAAFVRDDELRRAWEIFTPLLKRIENENVRPITYTQGGRGPDEADEYVSNYYKRNEDYVFYEEGVSRKTEGETAPPTVEVQKMTAVPEEERCDIGLWGLAVMGQNFALNMASHGFSVCVGNRSSPKVATTVERAKKEGNLPITGSKDAADFVAHLSKPRKIVILVQAGKPVDDTISNLAAYMEPGDLIIDGGNEWFPNSIKRAKYLEPKGIHFMGMGISGGEEGARNGPSLMPGGPQAAYTMVEDIFTKCAAQVEGIGACVGYLGPVGSGNYVKMVHNGIEYGDMQLIAEVYDVLKNILGMNNAEMADLFEEWNKTELASYLIEITYKVLRKKDDQGKEGEVVDYVLDKTGMKGTGRWTIQEAAERSVAAPTMAAALDARMLSGRKEERVEAEKVLMAPQQAVAGDKQTIIDNLRTALNASKVCSYGEGQTLVSTAEKVLFGKQIDDTTKQQVIGDLRAALYASKVCSYAQGLSLIEAASTEFKWDVDLSECARLWMGGCIIRADLLTNIKSAFKENPSLPNLLVNKFFAEQLNQRSTAWRRIVALCVTSGIACPSLCSSLTYFDTYRRGRLPANLTQAQRDFFGGHTYERTDMEGRFHTAWTDAHMDIGDANQRVEGEKLQTA